MDQSSSQNQKKTNEKQEQLDRYREKNTGSDKQMTSDAGVKISNDERSLRAGKRGPTLLQDAHFYKKQSHFNRERIPEKVVHARGFGLYGDFELYKSMKHVTTAGFLQEPGSKTPAFVRFSNFIGSKGSKDTAIDVRGFATKFYTQEGNYDMLALQFPVFLVADAMKFADMVHSIKPNPKTDVPQAAAAHDNFWDYVANNQETAHMVMWLMSMRGRPRSWRMMEGYPINTFRFINNKGKSTFVRFAWKPLLGVHGLLLDEANIIGGVDPDFHRHDIIEAVEREAYPEYELGVQLIDEEDEFKYDFDILDDTKMWPEEEIPFEMIGKLTLNRLVDNFFTEEEQSTFDPSNLIPGIDFSNDPVLQGRSFAYRDTDYHRLESANIEEIPVNKPIAETNINHRNGYMRHRIDVDTVHYHNNSTSDNTPATVPPEEGGFYDYPEEVEGYKTREFPSESFDDHFSQARMFWNSMSGIEKQDIIQSFSYHLGKVKNKSIRQQNIDMWENVDKEMATKIAENVGVNPPEGHHVPVDKKSPSLSIANTTYAAYTQKVGVLIGNDFNDKEVTELIDTLQESDVIIELISEKLGTVSGKDGTELEVDQTFITAHPVLFDSLFVAGGKAKNQEMFVEEIKKFVNDTYIHYKPLGIATGEKTYFEDAENHNLSGVIFAEDNSNFADDFVSAVTKQRFWDRK